jgi:hypothetical protein
MSKEVRLKNVTYDKPPRGVPGPPGADVKAKVSADDTTAGYLNGKLVAGTDITLTENFPGGNETLTIAATGGVTGGNAHDHVGGDGAQIDHGGLGGLGDDDHTIYTLKATLTEKGDLYYASAASTPAARAHGTAGQILRTGGHGADPTWIDNVVSITYIIDGGGSAISTGLKGFLEIPFACTVTAWTLLADQVGSIVIDIWRDSYANFPPTNADAMPGGGNEPTLVGVQNNQSLNLAAWTTVAISAGDILAFQVDSAATVTRCTLALRATKT